MEFRINTARKLFAEQNLDAVLISSVPNIFYLTGYAGFSIEDRDAFVLLTKTDGYIFTHALFAEAMHKSVPHLKLQEFTREKRLWTFLEKLIATHKLKKIGIEETNLTVAEYKKLQELPCEFLPIQLGKLREIKETTELSTLQKACKLSEQAYEYIRTKLKPGVTEKAIVQALELYFVEHGATVSFRSVVAFGKNASVPHHLSGETKLKKNDCILIDFGAKIDGYCADVCRTAFIGDLSEKHKKVYETAHVTMQKAIKYIETTLSQGKLVSSKHLDEVAREYIVSQGYEPYPHMLGHGVGLLVHESPHLSPYFPTDLENGMVFTMEPGIYLPGEVGVRIEDVFTIQNNKLIPLTTTPKNLIQL